MEVGGGGTSCLGLEASNRRRCDPVCDLDFRVTSGTEGPAV